MTAHHRLTDSPARGRAVLALLRQRPAEPEAMAPRNDPTWRLCDKCQHSATSVYAGRKACIRCQRSLA